MIIFDTIKKGYGSRKKKKRFDMDVGSIGGLTTTAAGSGAAANTQATDANSQNIVNSQAENSDPKMNVGNDDDGSTNIHISTNINMDMHTQDFTALKGMSESSECSNHDFDMKKLIELILAIKLLEEVNKAQQDKGGFSTVA